MQTRATSAYAVAHDTTSFVERKKKMVFLLPVHKGLNSFQLCGYTGFALAFVQSSLLVGRMGLSQLTLLGITGVVILTFYVLMTVTKILAGEEVIIYYHHEISVVATIALFLWLRRQPVLPYLDITVLGLGLFLACGRVGCLMVGCCHGRPSRWGVTYGDEHAAAGFPRYLVGVRLFPVQAVESIFAVCIVASGIALLLNDVRPGTVLVFYVLCYGWVRFCLEFARGDIARRWFMGFSEGQWTSLLLALAVSGAERAGILPASKWHWAVATAMGVLMILVSLWRRFDSSHKFEIAHPRHVRELRGAWSHLAFSLRNGKNLNPAIHVVRTSLGFRFSAGQTIVGSQAIRHFSVSRDGSALSLRSAQILSRLIACFEPELSGSLSVVPGRAGIFHIFFASSLDVSRQSVGRRSLLPLLSQPMNHVRVGSDAGSGGLRAIQGKTHPLQ